MTDLPPNPIAPINDQVVEKRRFKHRPPEGLVPGTLDSLPDRFAYIDWILFEVSSIALTHELKRIETPILEKVATLTRGLGEDTDIIEEQLFRVTGKSGDAIALRPDMRPGIARTFAQDKFSGKDKPVRLWHSGPLFRVTTLQPGMYREFGTFGFEIIGEKNPVLDAQVIQMAWKVMRNLGLQNMIINVNTVGCLDCRPEYVQQLKEYYETRQAALCKKCRKRRTTNPLRLLACQEEKCVRQAKEAPQIVDHLCELCHQHFTQVLEFLDDLEIPYSLNPQLVPEIDYYTRTVFMIWPDKGDKSKSIFSGGRYDDLVEKMGGRPMPAVGITGGLDRLVLALQEQAIKVPPVRRADVYFSQLSTMAKKKALKIFDMLRQNGVRTIENFGKNSLTQQIEQATKLGVPLTLILGQKEVLEETIILRDMKNGVQEIVPQSRIVAEIKKRLTD
jgi:histidyl-tRNA synthetase